MDCWPVFNGLQKPVDTVAVELILTEGVPRPPDFNDLSHAEKDALIRALWQRLEAAEQRIAELEARLGEPSKTPNNSSLPPSKGQKPNKPETGKRIGPRQGSLGRKGAACRVTGSARFPHLLQCGSPRGRSPSLVRPASR